MCITTKCIDRHPSKDESSTGHSDCDCSQVQMTPKSLKQGMEQWKIFPKVIHLDDIFSFSFAHENFPEVLHNAVKVNGTFILDMTLVIQKQT